MAVLIYDPKDLGWDPARHLFLCGECDHEIKPGERYSTKLLDPGDLRGGMCGAPITLAVCFACGLKGPIAESEILKVENPVVDQGVAVPLDDPDVGAGATGGGEVGLGGVRHGPGLLRRKGTGPPESPSVDILAPPEVEVPVDPELEAGIGHRHHLPARIEAREPVGRQT